MKWQQLQIPIILILVMYITVSLLLGGTDEGPLPTPSLIRTPRPTFELVAGRDSGPVARIILPTNTLSPTRTPLPLPTSTATARPSATVHRTNTPRPSPTKRPTTRPPAVITHTSTVPPSPTHTVRPSPTGTPRPLPTRTPTADPTSTATRAPSRTPSLTPTPPLTPRPATHSVWKGESLSSIALQYDTTVDALVTANELEDPNSLQIGQVLNIPSGAETMTAEPTAPSDTPRPTETSQAAGTSTATAALLTVTHTVKSGETLWDIAVEYGVTVQDIVDENDIESSDLLQIGQVLDIPLPSPSAPTPSPTPTP